MTLYKTTNNKYSTKTLKGNLLYYVCPKKIKYDP